MTKLKQAARQALGALVRSNHGFKENPDKWPCTIEDNEEAITALREALAEQAEQEPVAFKFVRYVDGKEMAEGVTIEREKTLDAAIKKAVALCPNRDKTVLVYAAPVQQVDLTDYEIVRLYAESPMCDSEMIAFARAVIAAYKEKNK